MAVNDIDRAKYIRGMLVAMSLDGNDKFRFVDTFRDVATPGGPLVGKVDAVVYKAFHDKLNSNSVKTRNNVHEKLRDLHESFKQAFLAFGVDDPSWDDANCPADKTLEALL